jgi:hypothetical protein
MQKAYGIRQFILLFARKKGQPPLLVLSARFEQTFTNNCERSMNWK